MLNVMMSRYFVLCSIDPPSQSKKKVQRKTKSLPHPHMLFYWGFGLNFQGSRFRNQGSRVPCILRVLKCYLHPISTILFTIVFTQFLSWFLFSYLSYYHFMSPAMKYFLFMESTGQFILSSLPDLFRGCLTHFGLSLHSHAINMSTERTVPYCSVYCTVLYSQNKFGFKFSRFRSRIRKLRIRQLLR